jgi:hypothetical protein
MSVPAATVSGADLVTPRSELGSIGLACLNSPALTEVPVKLLPRYCVNPDALVESAGTALRLDALVVSASNAATVTKIKKLIVKGLTIFALEIAVFINDLELLDKLLKNYLW